MTTPEPERRPWIVGCRKIASADRDIAHAVLTESDDRGFYDVIGADDDPSVPLGADVTYRVELTDEEAERFRQASNCRYVELDVECRDGDVDDAVAIPAPATLAWMHADFAGVADWHGRDILIGLLDGGTTAAVRSALNVTMVARQNFQADDPGSDEITSTHGCMVAPCLLPQGGRFLDAIVSSNAGGRLVSNSVAAAKWCADQGAKVINYSGSGPDASSAWNDMFVYLRDRGVQFFASAGNDGVSRLYYPAALSTTYDNCHSSISFDKNTGKRSTFSCYSADGSGCAPGTSELGMNPSGATITWSGTSASSPHMARLCAMGMTGGRFTAVQVGGALKANTRDTGQPDNEQGHGAYDLQAALTALGGLTAGPVQSGADYHPVAIVWPASDAWPEDGEADFMENGRPGDTRAEAFIHYPHSASVSVQQEHATKPGVDLSQWHNFAYEWTPDGVTGYLDGAQWFHYAGGAITGTRKNIQDMPSGHLTLQLDNFTGNSGLIPATMEVDWVKVYSLTPQGGGGGGGASTGTLADRLKLGVGAGLTKVNLGIGFLSGQGPAGKQGTHVDFPLNVLTQASLPAEFAGYCDLRDDGAVRLTSYIGGGHTPKSQKARTEFRGLAQDGVAKQAFDSREGVHYAWIDLIVRRACPGRPDLCLVQCHTPDDDLAMVRWINGSVISTFGDSGRPGTLATNVPVNTRMKLMLRLERIGPQTRIGYYYNDMTSPAAVQDYAGAGGNYMKLGLYNQSDPSYDEIGQSAVIDVYGCGIWDSGDPEPVSRY